MCLAIPGQILSTAGDDPLLRMGRGKMMGVDHNKGLRWVGASAGLIAG